MSVCCAVNYVSFMVCTSIEPISMREFRHMRELIPGLLGRLVPRIQKVLLYSSYAHLSVSTVYATVPASKLKKPNQLNCPNDQFLCVNTSGGLSLQ